ncbi:hypothetical protein PPERSA_04455 [Pseudocohnilembus persalinus]|uniref:Transmembrane protein n=1 Tax=Pseudocohnilembus persalinus TaxID=266149 RepID=A0A0V0QRJ1_PSEPJ|nr:hypothetical protein PPERSA_04455 [Pseudocohnilembus persalinus]|eukprot:KRX04640.1 hypothetical protein PPERSA_04455 [Pseudocohnilembus persalinus]
MFLTVMNFVTNSVQCMLKSFFEQRNLKKFLKQSKNLNSEQIKHFWVQFYGISTSALNQEINDNIFENNGEKNVLNLEKFESLNKEAIKNSQLSKQQQKIIYSLAGALAGFMALATQPQQSRKIWVIFTMTRALDFLYNGMVSRGYIPKWKYSYVLIFALINMLTVYAYSTDPKQVTMGIIKHYNFVYNPHKQDDLIRTTMIMKKYNHLKSKGINEEFNFEHAKAINKEIKPILIKAQQQYLKNKQII